MERHFLPDEEYYIIQHNDKKIREKAQSGGVFTALAEVCLKKGGVVYGAALNSSLEPVYCRVDNSNQLSKLQGSKYVQCKVNNTFREVKTDLESGRQVVYSGTSCVIAGLLKYLKVSSVSCENLITCDFICHGVASTGLWMEHIQLQKERFGDLESVQFRAKEFGWRTCMETYTGKDGRKHAERVWNDLYFTNAALRKTCYQCQFLDVSNKVSDITMGDYFGSTEQLQLPGKKDSGISFAVCHTSKGRTLLMETDTYRYKSDRDSALEKNLKNSPEALVYTAGFWKTYHKSGYERCLKKYTVYGGILFRLKRKVMKILGRW